MVMNKMASPPQSIDQFMTDFTNNYLPVSYIAFGPNQVVLPQELPPTSMVFPNPTFNRMLNIPGQSAFSVYDYRRTGVMGV